MRIFSSWRRRALATLTLVAGIALVPIAVHAAVSFGPSRPTFTMANPATYITFNSITDNPAVGGDERFFITARDVNASTSSYTNRINVQDNETLAVRIYFHNNASANLNLVAHNTKVRIALPTNTATSLEGRGFISATNANPTEVWSSMDFNSASPFSLEYVPGSASIRTNDLSDVALPDAVVGPNGTLIGFSSLNGDVPGCSHFSGFVTIKVRVHVQTPPQVKFACTGLDVTQIDRTRFDFTAHASVQNATVKSYDFNAKDSNSKTVDSNTVNTNALSAVYHFNQSNPGTYTVSAVVNTDKGSTKASDCTKKITVQSPPVTPPVTPPTTPPQVLSTKTIPNTGPGSVVALFAGVSAAGAIGHYLVTRRRASL